MRDREHLEPWPEARYGDQKFGMRALRLLFASVCVWRGERERERGADLFISVLNDWFLAEKKGFWSKDVVDFFDFLENIGKVHPPARKMLDIISHYPTAKTSKGKQATAIEIAIR